jgi:hypothetical protein
MYARLNEIESQHLEFGHVYEDDITWLINKVKELQVANKRYQEINKGLLEKNLDLQMKG